MSDELVKALEPCPFCGGEGLLHRVPGVGRVWRVSCKNCDAAPSGTIGEDGSGAVAKWNRRAAYEALHSPAGDVERVAEAMWQAESRRAAGRDRLIPWSEENEEVRANWRDLARAAIAAHASALPAAERRRAFDEGYAFGWNDGQAKMQRFGAAPLASASPAQGERIRRGTVNPDPLPTDKRPAPPPATRPAQPQADHPAGEQDGVERDWLAYHLAQLETYIAQSYCSSRDLDSARHHLRGAKQAAAALPPRDDRDGVVEALVPHIGREVDRRVANLMGAILPIYEACERGSEHGGDVYLEVSADDMRALVEAVDELESDKIAFAALSGERQHGE
jgi:Lar family restriction alleviation protein